jgi:FKBP-type peptidyl-prolyl cis-trans isomerase SlyD
MSKKATRGTAFQSGTDFQGGPGMMVTAHYRLFDAEGELVEESQEGEPLQLLLGYGQAAPKVEAVLAGAGVDDVRRVELRPRDAFGPRDPSLVVEFAREEFPAELAVGDELEAEDHAGKAVPLKIVDLDEERVVVDTNHPLAGQTVALELRVVTVRPATTTEIDEATARLQQGPSATETAEEGPPLLPVASLLRHLPQRANGGRSTDPRPRSGSGNRGPSS